MKSVITTPNTAGNTLLAWLMDWEARPVAATKGMMGVPTAPNDVPNACPMAAIATAGTGETPLATSIGAASATGVPKPAAPSMKREKNHPIKNTRKRGLGACLPSVSRITGKAPVSR